MKSLEYQEGPEALKNFEKMRIAAFSFPKKPSKLACQAPRVLKIHPTASK
jgi:hypothetical protein